jgi:O-antigen chain-terminating methyltransferase
MMSQSEEFYASFEDQFRGDRELIKERVAVYLPLVRFLRDATGNPALRVLDIGCGRGEWLEVLRDGGIAAYGRDTNEVMVSRCRSMGLDVAAEDALSHLRGLPPDSLLAVTGFHIIEHLPLPEAQTLLAECLRVLSPGGMLILETPNPENVRVGAQTFYVDPTHLRPLPAELLLHLAQAAGFAPNRIVKLHPEPRLAAYLHDSTTPLERDAAYYLFGPQDYALIAMKQAPGGSADALGAEIDALQERAQPRLEPGHSRAMKLAAELDEIRRQLSVRDAELNQARREVAARKAEISAVYHSWSWRLTAPLRRAGILRRRLTAALRRALKFRPPSPGRLAGQALRRIGQWVLAHPLLAGPLKRVLRIHPKIYTRLQTAVLHAPQGAAGANVAHPILGADPGECSVRSGGADLSSTARLPRHAAEVLQDLKRAMGRS